MSGILGLQLGQGNVLGSLGTHLTPGEVVFHRVVALGGHYFVVGKSNETWPTKVPLTSKVNTNTDVDSRQSQDEVCIFLILQM